MRPDIGGLALTAAVTLLIWYWAAGETRDTQRLAVRVSFSVSDAAPWYIQPAVHRFDAVVTGSRRAVRAAETVLRDLTAEVRPEVGTQSIDLLSLLRTHPALVEIGVTIAQTDPARIELEADRYIAREARVLRRLPSVRVEDDITVDPAVVQVILPSRSALAQRASITVEPVLSVEEIEALEPGRRVTLSDVNLRIVNATTDEDITLVPAQVSVSLSIRAGFVEHRLRDPVRVQLLSPPEDEGRVSFEPRVLRDVVIEAPLAIVEEIRSGRAVVIAVIQLRSDERERGIDAKRISGFAVIDRDGRLQMIPGRAGEDGEAFPRISLSIADLPPRQ